MIATTIMNNNYKNKMLELLVPTKYKMIPPKTWQEPLYKEGWPLTT